MKKINQFKTFIIIATIATIFGIIAITMRTDTNNPVVRTINDGISLVQNVAVLAADDIRNFGQSTFGLFSVHEENQRLRREVFLAELTRLQLDQRDKENEHLRQLVEINETLEDFDRVSAVVVGRNIDSWHDFLTVNQGLRDGIELGMAVVSPEGYLIGKITAVGNNFSRFHLMKPHNSSIRTQVEVHGVENSVGILEGYDAETDELSVRDVSNDVEIEIGLPVITTGFGDIFPRGLLAGHVTRYEQGALTQNIFLENNVNYDDIRFVFIIKRAMAAVVEDDESLDYEICSLLLCCQESESESETDNDRASIDQACLLLGCCDEEILDEESDDEEPMDEE